MRIYVTSGSGNSFKPVLALHQIDKYCELQFIDVLAGETRTPEFLKINPAGTVPFLVEDDGRALGESNAILWYLAEQSWLMPSSPHDRATALQWMYFEQQALTPYISPARFYRTIAPHLAGEKASQIPAWIVAGKRGLAYLDRYLDGRAFMTNHGYSIADIAIYGYTHVAGEAGIDLADFPAVTRWIGRIQDQRDYEPIEILLNPRWHEIPAALP